MNSKSWLYPIYLICVCMIISSGVSAQGISNRSQPERQNRQSRIQTDNDEQLGRELGMKGENWRLEHLRLQKLEDFLNLDSETKITFIKKYREMRREINRLQRERRQTINQLAQKVKQDNLTNSELQENILQFQKIDVAILEKEHQFILSLAETLTPEQVARFIIFHDRFENEIAQKVRNFRNQKMKRRLDSLNRNINDR